MWKERSMPRPWKTPRRRRRRLRRLGIPERVSDRPRFELRRSIRTVSLAEMNQAETRIGAADIAHETDLRFLETLESFAVQLEADDELLLDDVGVADPDDLGIGASDPDLELDDEILDDAAIDEVVLDDDEEYEDDSLDPDTSEILQAVERTFEELDEVDEVDETRATDDDESTVADDAESFDPSAPDTFGESVEAHSLQSWDGDSLDEYLGPDSESTLEPSDASWDGDSYEEYLLGAPGGVGAPASGAHERETREQIPRDERVDTWLAQGHAGALKPDEAHDPLGVGPGYGRDADGGEDDVLVGQRTVERTDELDDLALSLDLENTEEDLDEPTPRADGGIDPPLIGDLDPTPPAAIPRAGNSPPPADLADLSADSIEVRSENELIVQVGAGLDDAFSAEPLSLVLEGEDDAGELSVGPVDDLTSGLGIPASASLAALALGPVEPPPLESVGGASGGAATPTGEGDEAKGRGGDR